MSRVPALMPGDPETTTLQGLESTLRIGAAVIRFFNVELGSAIPAMRNAVRPQAAGLVLATIDALLVALDEYELARECEREERRADSDGDIPF